MKQKYNNQVVLIVDDDVDLCRSLQIQLKIEGYEVETAFNAARALELAFLSSPKLIFLDVHLHDRNGLSIISELQYVCPESNIIVFSSDAAARNQVKNLKIDSVSFLQKPFDLDEILRQVSSQMGKVHSSIM